MNSSELTNSEHDATKWLCLVLDHTAEWKRSVNQHGEERREQRADYSFVRGAVSNLSIK